MSARQFAPQLLAPHFLRMMTETTGDLLELGRSDELPSLARLTLDFDTCLLDRAALLLLRDACDKLLGAS